jgi:hypothetical protein
MNSELQTTIMRDGHEIAVLVEGEYVPGTRGSYEVPGK